MKGYQRTIFILENARMYNIESVLIQRFFKFFLLTCLIPNMISCNLARKKVENSMLVEKAFKSVPKLSLNMSPQIDSP